MSDADAAVGNGDSKTGSAAGGGASESAKTVGERFPSLMPLEEMTERAKLEQARAEARAATLKANVPSLDVELARDTVTQSDKTTGLARVLLQTDAVLLADQIANSVLDAACRGASSEGEKKRQYAFRIVSDLDVLTAGDAAALLQHQTTRLRERIDAYAPVTGRRRLVDPATLSVVAGLGVQAVGLASKLVQSHHTVSGREVPVDDLGFDLLLADQLVENKTDDESIELAVDRAAITPKSGGIVSTVLTIASDAELRVTPKVASASARVATKAAEIAADEAAIEALDAQILKLVERVPDTVRQKSPAVVSELANARSARETLSGALVQKREELSSARIEYETGTALVSDIETFLATALGATPGSRPPLLQAARAESLFAAHASHTPFVLYVRLIAGGLDQDIHERLIRTDNFIGVAGVSAEWALLDVEGKLLASNALSMFQSTKWELGEPESFDQDRINSTGPVRECVPEAVVG